MVKIKCDINQQYFENSWPPFCQIWIIFTHLKLWIASSDGWDTRVVGVWLVTLHTVHSVMNAERDLRIEKRCKSCSLECDMGKYSTRSMNEVWAFRRTSYSLNMCCIFPYRTKNEQRLYLLTRSSRTWHTYHNCAESTARVRYGVS